MLHAGRVKLKISMKKNLKDLSAILAILFVLPACGEKNIQPPKNEMAIVQASSKYACQRGTDVPFIRPSLQDCDPGKVKDLFSAVDGNCLEITKSLLVNGASVEKQRCTNIGGFNCETVIFVAARKGFLEIAKAILTLKPNVNYTTRLNCGPDFCYAFDSTSPLREAALNGDLEMVRLLVQGGADVNLK